MIDKVVEKAYLGPPRSHADYSSWKSNVLKSEEFFLIHMIDGEAKGVIIVFSLKPSISISFDTLFEYICKEGTLHEKLVENTFDHHNPRIGIHPFFRSILKLEC